MSGKLRCNRGARQKAALASLLGLAVLLCSLPGVAAPANTPWPKGFGDNANRGRSNTSVTQGSQLVQKDTLSSSSCSTATIGTNGEIFFTTSSSMGATLQAYTVSTSETFQQLWWVNLSTVATFASAPSISDDGYAWIGAKAPTSGASRLIRVQLASPHTVDYVDLETSGAQTAAECPPALAADGTVYVSTASSGSGGGALVAAVDGSTMSVHWTKVLYQRGAMANNLPVSFFRLVLKDAALRSQQEVYLHGTWLDYWAMGTWRHTVVGYDGSGNQLFRIAGTDGFDLPVGTAGTPSGFPVLSEDGTRWYVFKNSVAVARSESTGSVLNTAATAGSGRAVAVLSSGDVLVPGSSLQRLTSTLGSSTSWSQSSSVNPTIDQSGSILLTRSDGSVWARWSSGTEVTSTTIGANGEITIRDSSYLVVKTTNGLSLLKSQ